jgi:hypothetical protein
MKLLVREITFYRLPLATRFPFRYGIASMTNAPQIFVNAVCEFNGEVMQGLSADLLPPKWFTKNPQTTFEEDDLPQMLRVIRKASEFAKEVGETGGFFPWWRQVYQAQADWAERSEVPPLLAGFGVSLVERAVLSAFCRWQETPLHRVLAENRLEIQLGEIRDELEGVQPRDVLPERPCSSVALRHTVGLGDPLTDEEILAEDRVDDGLPHSLRANIKAYGLKFFKIKLRGDVKQDRDRLVRLAEILSRDVGADARITVDGNENYRNMESFREHWESHCGDPRLGAFLAASLLMVEQPIHRDHALRESVGDELAQWDSAPPIIIDESDGELSSTPTALRLGYAGVSHKNCKGIIKGLANAASLALARKDGRAAMLSGEDLANFGPVALLQDLAMVAALGITHVERNGHHYFAGLSSLSDSEQQQILEHHSDLFERTSQGFVALAPKDGQLKLDSLNAAPFGPAQLPSLDAFATWDVFER